MKNKLEQFPSGIKTDASTAADVVIGRRVFEKQISGSRNLKANVFVGADALFGAPLVPSGSSLVNPPPILARLDDPYRLVGISQVTLVKIDFTYAKRVSIFAGMTVHNMVLFAVHSTTGNEPVRGIGLVSVAAGTCVRL